MIFDTNARELPFDVPFQVRGNYEYRFPASLNLNERVCPIVNAVYRISALECSEQRVEADDRRQSFYFKLRVPYRVRNFALSDVVRCIFEHSRK